MTENAPSTSADVRPSDSPLDPNLLPDSAVEAASAAYLKAREEIQYFGASEDFTVSPIRAALIAFIDMLARDDEALHRGRFAYLNAPPHASKHGPEAHREHMRAALRAATQDPTNDA